MNSSDILKLLIEDFIFKYNEILKNENNTLTLRELCDIWKLGSYSKFEVKYSYEEGKNIVLNNQNGIIVDVKKVKDKVVIIALFGGSSFKHIVKNGLKDQDISCHVTGYASELAFRDADIKFQNLLYPVRVKPGMGVNDAETIKRMKELT